MQGFAGNQITAGEVGDSQWIAIAAVCEHELALVVGAPQVIGLFGHRQRCTGGFVAPACFAFDQAVTIKDGMHRADRRGVDIRIKPGQSLPDLRRAPMWLVLLASHDQRLDLDRQLIGMPIRSPRAIGQSFQADIVVALEDLVAGLARNVEVSAHRGHLLPIQEPGNEF